MKLHLAGPADSIRSGLVSKLLSPNSAASPANRAGQVRAEFVEVHGRCTYQAFSARRTALLLRETAPAAFFPADNKNASAIKPTPPSTNGEIETLTGVVTADVI